MDLPHRAGADARPGDRPGAGRLAAGAVHALLTLVLALAGTGVAAQDAARPVPVPSRLGEAVRFGAGDPVLLLIPCASCRWRSFDEFMARNGDRYTMLAVTLPGYGGSEPPELPLYSPEHQWHDHVVAGLVDLLDDQGVEEVVVLGHSVGSLFGLELAHRHPQRVRGLVNLDGWPTNGPEVAGQSREERLGVARAQMERYVEPLRDLDEWQSFNMTRDYFDPERRVRYHGWFMATPRDVMASYWFENPQADRNAWFRTLPMPYLDVQTIPPGADDPDGLRRTYEEAVDSAGRPERYTLIFVYDTYHYVMEQRPELLDDLIARFVAGDRIEDIRPAEGSGDPAR